VVRSRLDVELVRRGLVESRARAADAIERGRVLVGGAPADRAARQVSPSESVTLVADRPSFVSRGGEKLAAALDAFAVPVAGRRAADIGASTGGFTDCLLQRGAAAVCAIDVGAGQLAWSLRTDPRVRVLERCNARDLQPEQLGGAVPLAVVDVSFISLQLLVPALRRVTGIDADLVALVKPQFEAGPDRVPRGGVVRDPAVHADVLRRAARGLAQAGLPVIDAVPSPILGHDGNREFLLHLRRSGTSRNPEWVASLAGATG
jgi:23S rRNA (cytidine1920-2'-O)/16S rRNA (cytidine1409-2'-O)-methyltransferase